MSSLLQLVSRVRAWRLWHALRRPLTRGAYAIALTPVYDPGLTPDVWPVRRDVTPHGVRVYSLCGACGAHLAASATLCDACAGSRPMRNA